MSSKTIILAILNLVIFSGGLFLLTCRRERVSEPPREGGVSRLSPIEEKPVARITVPRPSYKNYNETVNQLKAWEGESSGLAMVGVYGKSSAGKDLTYIKIGRGKEVVLVTACIHGNEPLSASTVMWYIGVMLEGYGKDGEVTEILDSREVYFVPVLSPDSYPNSRHVDGVDPNRDFPGPSRPSHRSCAPVRGIQDLYNKIKPKAVMSGHTWGRVYLTPYGDSMEKCPDHDKITAVTDKMKALSGYRCIRACEMYQQGGGLNNPPIRSMGLEWGLSVPIHGSELDWYYRGGAFSTLPNGKKIRQGAFSVVCEFGTHQIIPTMQDTRVEFEKTFPAFLVFLREAPLVEIWWDEQGNAVNPDGTPKK